MILGCFFFSLGNLSCKMLFKGFEVTFCQSLRTFCITARTRRNDIFDVEFLGRNLSLSSCRCCHIYSSKPTLILQPNESSHRSCMQLCVTLVVFSRLSHRFIKTSHCPYNINLLGNNVTFDSKPKKVRTHFRDYH